MTTVVRKIAASATIKVSVGHGHLSKDNITCEKSGANPEKSIAPAKAVMRSARRSGSSSSVLTRHSAGWDALTAPQPAER